MAFNITPAAIISNVLSGANVLNSIIKVDVVGVLDQETLQQVFSDARPVKATVKENSAVMRYPVESGVKIADHRVIENTIIDMVFIIGVDAYSSAYQAIRSAWQNATLLSVQTRTGTYRNMIIADMPHEEDADMASAITQFVRFEEVKFIFPNGDAVPDGLSNYAPRDPTNAITVDRGLISAVTAGTGILSYFRALSVWGL